MNNVNQKIRQGRWLTTMNFSAEEEADRDEATREQSDAYYMKYFSREAGGGWDGGWGA
jgi:hypothetical protein